VGDSGLYSCTLKNHLGQETVQMKVVVVDKPGSCGISYLKMHSKLFRLDFRYSRRTIEYY